MKPAYEKLVAVLSPKKWYTGKELCDNWGCTHEKRKKYVHSLVRYNMLERRGQTTNTQYKKVPAEKWGTKAQKKKIVPTPKQKPTSLDGLIDAATALGTENELLKQTLRDISSNIERALEKL